MVVYLTPGVYFERIDLAPRTIGPVRTDIAGFVGLAERGPVHAPTRVNSWKQFASLFGGFVPNAYLPYAVKAFFDNGGRACYIVRAAGPAARHATFPVPGRKPVAAAVLTADTLPGATTVQVSTNAGMRLGDVVFLKARGRREHGVAVDLDPVGLTVALDRSLQWSYPAGSPVTAFASVLGIAAASPGAWANHLRITLTRAPGGITVTTSSAQPRDGTSSLVASVAGFEAGRVVSDPVRGEILVGGSLVRIWQRASEVLRRVKAIDPPDAVRPGARPLEHELVWSAPLPTQAFDLGTPLFLETVELTLEVALGGIRERYLGLSTVFGHSRYIPDVVNNASTLVQVSDLLQLRDAAHPGQTSLDPAWIDAISQPPKASAPPAPPWPPHFPVLDLAPSGGLSPRDDRPVVEEMLPDGVPGPALVEYLSNGFDDLASLLPQDFTDVPPQDFQFKRGLRSLGDVNEVAIVAVPDATLQPVAPPARVVPPPRDLDPCAPVPPRDIAPPPALVTDAPPGFSLDQIEEIQRAMIAHCEMLHDRVAVLDPPNGTLNLEGVQNWRVRLGSERGFAALYYPWLGVYDPVQATGSLVRAIPPSGHVTGIYARTDLDPSAGVHKAPANASLEWITDVTAEIGDTDHGLLNEQGIDVIRTFPGRGIRVFGARTLSRDPDWRYVNVRRLVLMVEKAIQAASQWAVFEPNTFLTRETLRLSASTFLVALWKRGALAGVAPEDAFFVKCDEENNPPALVEAGQLIVEIGVAPTIPAEFVVFRLGRIENQLVVTE